MICKPDSALVNALHGSPNYGDRKGAGARTDNSQPNDASMLIMHYTGMKDCAKALDWLSRPQSNVSCHYVIDVDGVITQMVAENKRAWHAGAGSWAGETDINSVSIGIEIHNAGIEHGYSDFPIAQMDAVTALAKDIVNRNNIAPRLVLGHSDVSPQRKADPGEKFDWAGLARAGVGYWLEPVPVDASDAGIGHGDAHVGDARIAQTRELLHRFGYGIKLGGPFDIALHKTQLAFQRHYRPARCDGRIDASSMATLQKLLDGPVVV